MASWVVRHKQTKEAVMETFYQETADKVNQSSCFYEAVPALQYLQELNRSIREGRAGGING